MSRNYKFHNPDGLYFVSFAVVGWLEIFVNEEYTNLLLESLKYCQQNKGMEIIAWCIMPNHVHLVFRSADGYEPNRIIGDFKRYTSKAIVRAIIKNTREKRKAFLLDHFRSAAKRSSNVYNFQFWQHDNNPIELWSNAVIKEKVDYVHRNPVEAGLADAEDKYVYSSAIDYAGGYGLINDIVIFHFFG